MKETKADARILTVSGKALYSRVKTLTGLFGPKPV